MKKIKFLVSIALLTCGVNEVCGQKIAHVDTNEIMSKMPAMIEAQKQLQIVGKTYEDTFKTMTNEYQAKLKKYDGEATTAGDKVNEERAKEVQDLQKRIADYRENASKELETKQSEITKPIIEKVKASIKKIAKAKGIQYILNADALLVADGPDLTADVKKDLGF